jgi:hypothetical protein
MRRGSFAKEGVVPASPRNAGGEDLGAEWIGRIRPIGLIRLTSVCGGPIGWSG